MRMIKRATALVLVCAMGIAGLTGCSKSPKEKVMDALATLFAGESGKALNEELGLTEILESIEEKPFTLGMDLTYDEIADEEMAMMESFSISGEAAYDLENYKMAMDVGVGYAGSDILSAQIYADKEQLAVKVPELLEEVFYVEFDNIAEQLKKAAIVEMAGGISEEDLALIESTFASSFEMNEEMTAFLLGFEAETGAIKDFKDAIEVEEIGNKEFEINGKDRKCEGFEVVITEESMMDFVDAALEYYLLSDDAKEFWTSTMAGSMTAGASASGVDGEDVVESFELMIDGLKESKEEMFTSIEGYISDIEAEMYIYDGEIASLEAEMEITDPSESMGTENVKVGVALECTGGDYSMYDNYEFDIQVMGMDMITIIKETDNSDDVYEAKWTLTGMALEDYNISCTCEFDKKDGDYEIVAVMEDSYNNITINMNGTLEVEKKKSFVLTYDEIDVVVDGETMFGLSGEYSIECDAEVKMLEGEKFNVLTEKQSDWEALMAKMEDIQTKLNEIMANFN